MVLKGSMCVHRLDIIIGKRAGRAFQRASQLFTNLFREIIFVQLNKLHIHTKTCLMDYLFFLFPLKGCGALHISPVKQKKRNFKGSYSDNDSLMLQTKKIAFLHVTNWILPLSYSGERQQAVSDNNSYQLAFWLALQITDHRTEVFLFIFIV